MYIARLDKNQQGAPLMSWREQEKLLKVKLMLQEQELQQRRKEELEKTAVEEDSDSTVTLISS